MSAPVSERKLRVVSGSPTVEELAAVSALLAAAANATDVQPVSRVRRGGWNDPAAMHRSPLLPGPNGWRAAAWR